MSLTGEAQGRFGQWVHTAWTEQEGAPSSVRGLARSPDGFLWIASADGLFRFDGTFFERVRFSSAPGETASSVVNVLFGATNGDVWMATPEAVGFIRANQVRLLAKGGTPYPSRVRCFKQDRDGSIWAAAANGLFRWSGESWQAVAVDAGLQATAIKTVFFERDGSVLASSGVHLYERRVGAETFTLLPVSVRDVNDMQQDATGRIWLADTAGGGVHPLVRPGSTDSLSGSEVAIGSYRLLVSADSELWMTSLGDGLMRIEDLQRPFGHLVAKSPQLPAFRTPDGLSDDYMQTILEDKDGAIWTGTRHGLDCFRKSTIATFPIRIQNSMSLAAGADGSLWIAENSHLTHAIFQDSRVTATRVYAGQTWNSPLGLAAVPVCDDMDYGVLCASSTSVVVFKHPQVVPSTHVNARVAVDHDHTVWLAKDSYGIFRRAGDDWKSVPVAGNSISDPVSAAHVGTSGTVWFAFASRLMTVQAGTLSNAPYAVDAGIGTIQAIEDRGDHIWLGGTRGLALIRGSRTTKVQAASGDLFTDIAGIKEGRDGDLWITTQHAVLHVAPRELRHAMSDPAYKIEPQTLGAREGFVGHGLYQEELSSDGALWLVSQESVLHVDTSHIGESLSPPATSVRDLEANGQRVPLAPTVQLPAHTTNVRFHFVGINLADPTHVSYRYRLTGLDQAWQNNGADRDAMYTNLSPGEYDFHVVSRNDAGDWGPDDVNTRVVILPAWYQRTLVKTSAAAFGLLLAWVFFSSRVRSAERAFARAFDERLDERTRMARELHDTFLQTVQGSKMVADDALDADADQVRMRHALERLSLWLGQAVDEGRAALHALRVSTTERNHIAEFLERTAREQAEKKAISVALTVIGDARDLHPIVRDEVSRIAEEAIRNACLHSNASQLRIELRYARDLKLLIKDNGIGMNPEIAEAGKPERYGLQGMKERSARIRAALSITSTLNAGTQVLLSVPGDLVYRRNNKPFVHELLSLRPWSRPSYFQSDGGKQTEGNKE